jgi:hypothetical protein
MIVVIAILMAAIAVAIVIWPVVRGARARLANNPESDLVSMELLARREAALTAIKDLEFDYAVGKIEEEDFQILNAQLRAEAIEILKEIDQQLGAIADKEAQLERKAARKRRKRAVAPCACAQGRPASLEAQVEAEIAALRRPAQGRSCARCGAALAVEDRFCRRCGTLAVSEVT